MDQHVYDHITITALRHINEENEQTEDAAIACLSYARSDLITLAISTCGRQVSTLWLRL
uniref:Uncharacterized protein n=1 Tax=Anguilla anguilla TaxID=7936 RepID=A0A0E9WFQ0_ANGAN